MFGYIASTFANLPFPSAYAGALSSALQRQVLRYILKRALGRLIQDGDLRPEQIEAGLGNGRVELRDVHLDVDSINTIIKSTNLQLDSGLIGSISITVPWSNLLTGELRIEIANVDAQFTLVKRHWDSEQTTSLGESVLSVAEEIFEEDEEGRELEASIASFVNEEEADDQSLPQAPQIGFVARQMGNIVARTSISLRNLILRVGTEKRKSGSEVELQVRCDTVDVKPGAGQRTGELERDISIDGLSLWIEARGCVQDSLNQDDSSDASDDESDMGMSTADLRSSMATSMYASAVDFRSTHADATSGTKNRPAYEQGAQMIAKLGSEPFTIRVALMAEVHAPSRARQPAQQVVIQMQVGAVLSLLTPTTVAWLLQFTQDASLLLANGGEETEREEAHSQELRESNSNVLQLDFGCREIHMVCVYDIASNLGDQQYASYRQSCEEFWSRPMRASPSLGHLRLRVQNWNAHAMVDRRGSTYELSIDDVGLYESLSPAYIRGSSDMRVAPILVFDGSLPDHAKARKSDDTSSEPFKQGGVATLDWRTFGSRPLEKSKASMPYRKTDFSEQGWKLKGISSNDQAKQRHCIRLLKDDGVGNGTDRREPIQVDVMPVHVFVDTSAVDRLLPFMNHLAKRTSQNMTRTVSDLVASTSSFETVQAGSERQETISQAANSESSSTFRLTCPLVRAEVRVHTSLINESAPRNMETSAFIASGFETRSGIVVVEVSDIALSSSMERRVAEAVALNTVHFEVPQLPTFAKPQPNEESCVYKVGLSIGSGQVYYKDVDRPHADLFAILSPMVSDDEVEASMMPLLTYIEQEIGRQGKKALTDCRLPMAQVSLSKPLLDGLELMADDLSIWAANLREWKSGSDVENASDALRIIGSRFFGTRQSYSTLSSSSTSTEIARPVQQAPIFSLSSQDVKLTLQLVQDDDCQDAIHLIGSTLEIHFDGHHAPNSTRATISLANLTVERETTTVEKRRTTILERTIRPSLSRTAAQHILALSIISTVDPDTSFRGSQIDLLVQNFTLTYDGDHRLLSAISAFGRSPEGAFEHVEPNEVTRVLVRVKEASILLAPQRCASRAVCVLGEVSLRTKIVSDFPRSNVRFQLDDASLWCGESLQGQGERELRARRPGDLWNIRGLSKISDLKNLQALITLSTLTRPEVDVKVTRGDVELMACADTAKVVQVLIDSFPRPPDQADKRPKVARDGDRQARDTVSSGSTTPNLLASMDEEAFRRASTVGSSPDLLDDDVPSHPTFLQTGVRRSRVGRNRNEHLFDSDDIILDDEEEDGDEEEGSTLHSQKSEEAKKTLVLLDDDIVTIRLLDTEGGICPTLGYLASPKVSAAEEESSLKKMASSLRVNVTDLNVTVRLFGGYDCQSTRLAIEDEAKRVRKRLQKIKQMMDQGQTPDDSVEEAAASLFDSVHIPLPGGIAPTDMDAAALMQVVDEELDDVSETDSSTSTWKQFVPIRNSSSGGGSGPVSVATSSSTRTRRKRNKLARSRESMIDIEVKGIHATYDAFEPGQYLASSLAVRITSIRILDNIPTSTWHTFLTGMAPRDDPRVSDNMVRIELENVRPIRSADTVEARCKARVAPIRLHVDQDALDFLKKFFTFEVPGKNAAAKSESEKKTVETFIQHAEIYPIKLKLDYKPKRVDYRLLRQGKTIEMMNFFHFEGSEITLRHITLRGILGWPTLFDTLNDLWTPDVKSNQLADVLSGITPIRSLVNVGNGVADLILLPIEQYHRDGRLGKGLRDGAKRFAMTTALEAARIGARLATGTQVILERAESLLGGDMRGDDRGGGADVRSSDSRASHSLTAQPRDIDDDEFEFEGDGEASLIAVGPSQTPTRISRYANQPAGIRQALDEAQKGFSRGLNEAAQTILAVPMEVYDRQTGEGGNRPVIRAVPIAVLQSAAGASEAVSKTLQGIQRELAGVRLAQREEQEEKYKR